MLRQVEEAGSVSGRESDKTAIFKYSPATKVRTPVIQGCLGTIECTLNKAVKIGDHSVFFGNVLHSSSQNLGEVWAVSPLLHLSSDFYAEFAPLNIRN